MILSKSAIAVTPWMLILISSSSILNYVSSFTITTTHQNNGWGRLQSSSLQRQQQQGQKLFYSRSNENHEEQHNDNNNNNNNKESKIDPRESEFTSLDVPHHRAQYMQSQIEEQKLLKEQFVPYGEELWDLRCNIDQLSQQLIDAYCNEDNDTDDYDDMNDDAFVSSSTLSPQEVREKLREAERLDPNIVYGLELEAMEEALEEGREEDAIEHRENAMCARSCLPQFNFEGLWLGKYGDHGFEMVNITYIGDILVATKVTGDKNVPEGEITFQADLSPPKTKTSNASLRTIKKPLTNIVLSDEAAKRWGCTQLERHAGLGQVAEEGFVNSQWMDGQLVIINEEYFSFSWLPISHQIFFGRPSPELMLKMLRENNDAYGGGGGGGKGMTTTSSSPPNMEEDDLSTVTSFVSRCFDATEDAIDDEVIHGRDPFSCIFYDEDNPEECVFE